MTGEFKHGLYRIIEGNEVKFFRVRNDDDGNTIIFELSHETGIAQEIKSTRQLLTAEIWESLQRWQ